MLRILKTLDNRFVTHCCVFHKQFLFKAPDKFLATYLNYDKERTHPTSKDLFSYSFIAVMHWCLVLMLVVTPPFTIVSLPVGGCKKQRLLDMMRFS